MIRVPEVHRERRSVSTNRVSPSKSRAVLVVMLGVIVFIFLGGLALYQLMSRDTSFDETRKYFQAQSEMAKHRPVASKTYKGKELSYYLPLVEDRDDSTRLEALRACAEIGMFSGDVDSDVVFKKLAPVFANSVGDTYERLLALKTICVRLKWTNANHEAALQMCGIMKSIGTLGGNDKDHWDSVSFLCEFEVPNAKPQ